MDGGAGDIDDLVARFIATRGVTRVPERASGLVSQHVGQGEVPRKRGRPRKVNGAGNKFVFGGADRDCGGTRSRFASRINHAVRALAALPAHHPAITESRTLFPTRVKDPAQADRVLKRGFHQAKIGDLIEKGPWRGLHVYTLTLEERATCPAACPLLRECYGNAMPAPERYRHGPALEAAVAWEIDELLASRRNRAGIAVRLHILGDFYSPDYVGFWERLLLRHPRLHVWGYTAWPRDSAIGAEVRRLNMKYRSRWVVRFSVSPEEAAAGWQATTIWERPGARGIQPEGLICPNENGATAACVTCALCWSPEMVGQPIAFIGHGMQRGKNLPPKRERKDTT